MAAQASSVPLKLWEAGLVQQFPDLTSSLCTTSTTDYLIIQQRSLYDHPPAGLLPRARILVSQEGHYELQILLKTIEKDIIYSETALYKVAVKIYSSSPYKFCPGLDFNFYKEQYADILRYDSKSVKVTKEPFARVESHQCLMWHELAKNASIFEKDQSEVMCQPCKKMKSHLDQLVRTALKVTPKEKEARLDVSSRFPMSALSPASQKKRRGKLLKERNQYKKKLELMEVTHDDAQNDDMANIVGIVNKDSHRSALNEVIDGAGCQNRSEIIRELWQKDVQKLFKKDQASNGKFFCFFCFF